MKPITLEDYKSVSDEFFPKFRYVSEMLGEGSKTEDILKVMESLAALVLKKRSEEKKTSIGFTKEEDAE